MRSYLVDSRLPLSVDLAADLEPGCIVCIVDYSFSAPPPPVFKKTIAKQGARAKKRECQTGRAGGRLEKPKEGEERTVAAAAGSGRSVDLFIPSYLRGGPLRQRLQVRGFSFCKDERV